VRWSRPWRDRVVREAGAKPSPDPRYWSRLGFCSGSRVDKLTLWSVDLLDGEWEGAQPPLTPPPQLVIRKRLITAPDAWYVAVPRREPSIGGQAK
jgi:hypothetical protein